MGCSDPLSNEPICRDLKQGQDADRSFGDHVEAKYESLQPNQEVSRTWRMGRGAEGSATTAKSPGEVKTMRQTRGTNQRQTGAAEQERRM